MSEELWVYDGINRKTSPLLSGAALGQGAPCAIKKVRRGGLAQWQAMRVLGYIEANLASRILIHALARTINLSTSHFARAFKESMGLSPSKYIAIRRIEHAGAIMTSTRQRLADIALTCGFSDQSHLNRSFRDHMGITPGAWRRHRAAVTHS